MGWSLRLVWWMEGDPGTGQAGMEGNESDIGWLESKVSVGFWEQAQEAAGNAGFTEMELEGQRGCFANVPTAGEGPPQHLNMGPLPCKVCTLISRDHQGCSPPLCLSL